MAQDETVDVRHEDGGRSDAISEGQRVVPSNDRPTQKLTKFRLVPLVNALSIRHVRHQSPTKQQAHIMLERVVSAAAFFSRSLAFVVLRFHSFAAPHPLSVALHPSALLSS